MNRLFLAVMVFLALLRAVPADPAAAPAPVAPAVNKGVTDPAQRRQLQGELDFGAWPSVFTGVAFPGVDYFQPHAARLALGAYTIETRYFDAGWNEVKKPTSPGRYGVLAVVHFPDGTSDTWHITLYRLDHFSRVRDFYRAQMDFPAALGLPADIGKTESWNVDQFIDNRMNDTTEDQSVATLLAALHDVASDPARYHGYESWRIDNMWWDELEKRLGLAVPYPKLVRLPDGYATDLKRKWPLILFLHGSGERGSDLSILKKWGPAGYADQGHPLPFIVVTPQCSAGHRWNPELLMQLVADVEKTYRVDPSRLYVTGLSMGGIGSLDLAAAYPGRFAALACLSGREDPEIAHRLHGQPIWLFHGAEDDLVPAHDSIDLAAALKAQGIPSKLTLIPGTGHGGWDKVYANPALYAWFLRYQD